MNAEIDVEQWLPITRYDGKYLVSSLGRVKNKNGRILRFSFLPKGYQLVSLYKSPKSSSFKVSRLVASAFHPNPSGLPEVNHKNGIKRDDRACNLEWITSGDNMRHAWSTGLRKYKKPTRGWKLTHDQAREIRVRLLTESKKSLAAEFSISISTIDNIRVGRHWK